jgi:Ca2+-binding EF-hand superfamily protein
MADFHSKLQAILDDEDKLQEVSDKSFAKYDTDGSGFIETKEFRKIIGEMYAKLGMAAPSSSEIDSMLGELDADGNEKLDKAEFKEHTRKMLQGMLTGTLGL